ncbi:MAG TPA: hypothetical protein VMH23_13410 [Bacteroidota bacterium]|nr:hypothetical protein [Bacteroidota bacterium]
MQRVLVVLLLPLVLFLCACSAPPAAIKTAPPPAPTLATSVKMASIDLTNYGKRIEKKDIERFAAVLKKEQVEVLAVQGITRYPNVKTRVDFVNELAAQTDMRHAFGESIDIMGRQQGNAVFSVYPIRSNQKKDYDVPSAFSEYALHVAIDAGICDVTLVSTRLPARAPAEDLAACIKTITELRATAEMPFVVSGNLPALKQTRGTDIYSDVQATLPEGSGKTLTSQLWYVQRELFKLLQARTVKTELGTLTVAEFGLYQQVRTQ